MTSYAFIFSPNNSGTTIMSQYLEANIEGAYLPPFGNNEGQMAPNVKPIMRGGSKAWNPDATLNWKIIKHEWDKLAQAEEKTIFIEASPPNILRVEEILGLFKDRKFIFSLSSPYSYIASHAFSRLETEYNRAGKHLPRSPEKCFDYLLQKAAKSWLEKARIQQKNIKKYGNKSNVISYEEFCKTPFSLIEKLGLESKAKEAKSRKLEGKKNSQVTEIIDMGPKHLAFLGVDGIQKVNRALDAERGIVDFFDYKLFSLKECNITVSANTLLALDGHKRRLNCEKRTSNYLLSKHRSRFLRSFFDKLTTSQQNQ